MSDLFQVTIVVPAEKLGAVLSALPPKLQPQISRLVERGVAKPRGKYNKTRGKNGEYHPAPSTTGDALLRWLKAREQPQYPTTMKESLCKGGKHKPQGVSSALTRLVHFKLVKREPDGRYGVVR